MFVDRRYSVKRKSILFFLFQLRFEKEKKSLTFVNHSRLDVEVNQS